MGQKRLIVRRAVIDATQQAGETGIFFGRSFHAP